MTKLLKIFIFAICGFIISANFAFGVGIEPQRDLSIQLSNFLGFAVVSGLPEYISRIYNIMIGLAGGIASFMMIVAGFQYVLARGDASKIGQAKKRITNSVVALFLIFGAYFILNTINPAILSMKMPELRTISRLELAVSKFVTECMDITTEADCLAHSADRCIWLPVGTPGGGGRCVTQDINIGTNNHGCRPEGDALGRCNSGLRCIIVNPTIIGTGRELCSDGRVNSPCFENVDCVEPNGAGYCDEASKLCLGATNRPGAAPCTENSQCASGSCISGGICAAGTGIAGSACNPAPGRDLDELCGGTGDNLFCCTASPEDRAICSIETPTCTEKFDAGHSCRESFQCKSDYCNDNTCDCLGNFGAGTDSDCPSSSPTCVDDGILDRGDRCE